MMHEKKRRRDRGVVLIAIVGVLAVLSLLAATFGMIARLELATSRNQTEHEMAREAAHAGAEYLLNALQSCFNGVSMTSGPIPVFLPNVADTDGLLEYKRDGVKVYFSINTTAPAGSTTPDWMQGLGLQDAGMFNLNAMGFAGDLGSSVNPDIRYTSFDCSLVRLLTLRFASIATAPLNSNDMANLLTYDAMFGNASEQQRLAIILAQALITWRYGPDGLPGTAGTEERRLGHLPRWNSKLGATNINLGIRDALGNPYPPPPSGGPFWGLGDYNTTTGQYYDVTNFLGSLLVNWPCPAPAPAGFPESYSEPGGATTNPPTGEWRSYNYLDAATPWGNDQGLPPPGLFYGKVALSPPSPASTVSTIYADMTQPGWRDWPISLWNGYYVYFATGSDKWQKAQIQTTGTNVLNLAAPLLSIPNAGDAFCICPPPPWVGQLNQRWVTGDAALEGDLVPNAMLWPYNGATPNSANDVLATEGNVWDLMVDNDFLNNGTGQMANMGTCTQIVGDTDASFYDSTKSTYWTPAAFQNKNYVVHIYGGMGRGQVRTIYACLGNGQLQLYNPVTSNPPATVNPAYWTTGNTPDTTSQYRIEWADNNLTSKFQPNNLQGDDRLYLSLGSLRDSVIVPALISDGLGQPPPLATSSAQAVADILLPYFLPYITVSTQGIQGSQSLCSINDWAVDGVDNDANGTVDDNNGPNGPPPDVTANPPTEPQYEWSASPTTTQGTSNRETQLAPRLYNKLGLYTWAHAGAPSASTTTQIRIQQAAQLVANIIDFRDPPTNAWPDVPTKLTIGTLDPAAPPAIASTVVYGAKGLHVTQVMPSPDPIYSALNGAEMISNGSPTNNPLSDWAWMASSPGGYWYVQNLNDPGNPNPPGTPAAIFTFNHLMPGYYAMRLIGSPNTTFTLTYQGASYNVTTSIAEPENAALMTGFVRKPPDAYNFSRLVCFQVPTAGSLSFQLQPPVVGWQTAQFWGFALCAQYIQLTNISTHDILLSNLTVTTDQTQVATTGPGVIPWLANYTRANGGNAVDLRRIPGAAVGALGFISDSASGAPAVPPTPSTATFPITYGTYVICMSEESYEKQWSAQGADQGVLNPDPDYITASTVVNGVTYPSPNGDGVWGDAPNEAYTIYPFGDLNSDQYTMALLMGVKGSPTKYAPSVAVTDASGDLIAGGSPTAGPVGTAAYVDAPIPPITSMPGGTSLDLTYHDMLACYSSIEKTVILQPTWDSTVPPLYGPYWAPYVAAVAGGTMGTNSIPAALAASQNTLVIVQDDQPRIPTGTAVSFRACLNMNYTPIWDPTAIANLAWAAAATWPATTPPTVMWNTAKRWATLAKPSYMASQYRVFPFILNRPYPTTGWLGLVPTSNTDTVNMASTANPLFLGSWRTIDPNPTPSVIVNGTVQPNPPATPEQLLGTLMSNATVGGVYARFNINTAPVDTLKAVFPDATAQAIITARNARLLGVSPTYPWTSAVLAPALANSSWAMWDEFLDDPLFQYSGANGLAGIGFYDCHDPVSLLTDFVSNADAGAGTYADGFPDNSNEKKEWFMRYANLFCLQSTSFQFTVAGLVYADRPWDPKIMQNNEPVAMVRIEVDVDLSSGIPSIVHFRYLTQD